MLKSILFEGKLIDNSILEGFDDKNIKKDEQLTVDELEPGELDYLYIKSGQKGNTMPFVDDMLGYIKSIASYDCDMAKIAIENILMRYQVALFIDALLEKLISSSQDIPVKPYLYEYAKKLLYNNSRRELIKFGVSLLSVMGCERDDLYYIEKLAYDEEYTLYCICAVDSLLDNSEARIWEIAKNVHGSSKLGCLEKLKKTKSKAIKSWLLHEGYLNSYDPPYTALVCAISGELNKALDVDIIDIKLYEAATGILIELFLSDNKVYVGKYKDLIHTCNSFIFHSRTNINIESFALIISIKNFFINYPTNHNKDDVDGLIQLIERFLKDIDKSKITVNVFSDYDERLSDIIKDYFSVDFWKEDYEKLLLNPLNSRYWSKVLNCNLNDERLVFLENVITTYLSRPELINSTSPYVIDSIKKVIITFTSFPGLGFSFIRSIILHKRIIYYETIAKVLDNWGNSYVDKYVSKYKPYINL